MRVVIEGVSYRRGDVRIIEALSAEIEPGVVTAIVGPSGSGKTTLLSMVATLIRPTAGRIVAVVDGARRGLDPRDVVWVPQGSQVLARRTVIDNVMLGALAEGMTRATAERRSNEALTAVGVAHLSTLRCRTLSGGEAQRVAFARAMATTRPLVLADEPTANLDRRSAESVIEALVGIRGRRTAIVATHDEALADAAQQVVRLDRLQRTDR